MTDLTKSIKEDARAFFTQEVGSVSEKDFDVVFESITQTFLSGSISMACNMRNVISLLGDENARKVVEYLNTSIQEQKEEIEKGMKVFDINPVTHK